MYICIYCTYICCKMFHNEVDLQVFWPEHYVSNVHMQVRKETERTAKKEVDR